MIFKAMFSSSDILLVTKFSISRLNLNQIDDLAIDA